MAGLRNRAAGSDNRAVGSTDRGVGAFVRTASDIGSGTDVVARAARFARPVSDAAAGSDVGAALGGKVGVGLDAAGGTDGSLPHVVGSRALRETAGGHDVQVTLNQPFVLRRSTNRGGARFREQTRGVLLDGAGGVDACASGLIRGRTPVENDQARGYDTLISARGRVGPSHDDAGGRDQEPLYATSAGRARSVTDVGSGVEATGRFPFDRRVLTEVGFGRDLIGWLRGPRTVATNLQVLSQIWGKSVKADSYGAAIDLYPFRQDGSDPPLTNDTIGTDRGVGSTSTGNLMAGTDIGGLIDFGDGEIGVVGGDLFGPTVPEGYSNSHPSIGAGSTWTYYRPSCLAISKTQLAGLVNGLVIDRFHRRMGLKNPGQGLIEVDGAAPLQSDVTYVGSVPNRVATFPNHYYAFNSGVTIPDVGGDRYAYSCALITEQQGGLYGSLDKITWAHHALWTNNTAPYWGKGSALEIADANGNPPPSVAAVRADIAANTGTYYLYAMGSQLPTLQKGLYLGRCRLTQTAGTAWAYVIATSATPGLPPTNWEYWDGTTWGQQGVANPVPAQLMGDSYFNSLTNGGYSLRYNTFLGKWMITYAGLKKTLQGGTQLCYRLAPQIQGPWGDERTMDGMDLTAVPGTNVSINLTPYSVQYHPYSAGKDLYVVFSIGFPFNNPDPTKHAYIDDGTGHCKQWRSRITTLSTSADIGCNLTATQHNNMQAAYTAGTETPGFGFSVPYAIFLGHAVLDRALIDGQNGADISTTTDLPTTGFVGLRFATDLARTIDTGLGFFGSGRSFILDNAGGTDSPATVTRQSRTLSDSAAGTDIGIGTGAGQTADLAFAQDVADSFVISTGFFTQDAAGGTDQVLAGQRISAAGNVNPTETLATVNPTVPQVTPAKKTDVNPKQMYGKTHPRGRWIWKRITFDQAGGTDSLTVVLIAGPRPFARNTQDAAPAFDTSAIYAPNKTSTATDTAAGTDAPIVTPAAWIRAVNEAGAGTDNTTGHVPTIRRTIAETAGGQDSTSGSVGQNVRNATDLAPASDSPTGDVPQQHATSSDVAHGTDVASRAPRANARVGSDSAHGTDVVGAHVPTALRSTADSANGSDLLSAVLSTVHSFVRNVIDAANGIDSRSSHVNDARTATDTGSGADRIGKLGIVRQMADTAHATDIPTRQSFRARTASDVGTGTAAAPIRQFRNSRTAQDVGNGNDDLLIAADEAGNIYVDENGDTYSIGA